MGETIAGKVVIVTGASGGLGEAAATLLAAEGATLVLGARRQERLDALARNLADSGAPVVAQATDVADPDQVRALASRALDRFGRIDVILNNAGVMPLSRVEAFDLDGWNRMIDVNLKGVLHGIAAVLPGMIARRSGHVINVASTAAHRVGPTTAVYSATKYAVRALTEGLRQEMARHGIRVTLLSPGASATDLFEHGGLTAAARPDYAMPPEAFARMVAFAIAQPEEVAVNEILFRPTRQER